MCIKGKNGVGWSSSCGGDSGGPVTALGVRRTDSKRNVREGEYGGRRGVSVGKRENETANRGREGKGRTRGEGESGTRTEEGEEGRGTLSALDIWDLLHKEERRETDDAEELVEVLVGITSWGNECRDSATQDRTFSVALRVSAHCNFIRDVFEGRRRGQ